MYIVYCLLFGVCCLGFGVCCLGGLIYINLMPNHYFQFKQFTVQQDKCAMKVCTDSCLFGAWLNRWVYEHKLNPKHALDIGAGTGLLSLMMAQGNESMSIDAVEIEADAYVQASENVASSPFKNQIFVNHSSLQLFNPELKYDLIFSNPPFFENDLKSDLDSKNLAKHSVSLNASTLIDFISNNLSDNGKAALLIPYHRCDYFTQLISENGLYTEEIVHVNQSSKHSFFRSILLFSKEKRDKIIQSYLTIKSEKDQYSNEFIELLTPFYLNL